MHDVENRPFQLWHVSHQWGPFVVWKLDSWIYMDVSRNRGTSTSSILIGVSIINYPFWGYPYFWKHLYIYILWFSSSNFHASCLVFGQNWPCHRGFIPNLRFQLGSAFKHLLSFHPKDFGRRMIPIWPEHDFSFKRLRRQRKTHQLAVICWLVANVC